MAGRSRRAVGGGAAGAGIRRRRAPWGNRVLVMSLYFIGFVTALYIFGKLYRSRTAAASA